MKKVVFNDSRQIEVQSVTELEGILHIRMILVTPESLKAIFGDTFATQRMIYFENQQQIAVYENYTQFKYIKEETGGVFEVEMRQTAADTDERIENLEETARQQAEELKKVKEEIESGIPGVPSDLTSAAFVVAKYTAQELPDQMALQAKAIYEKFDELVKAGYTAKTKGFKFTHENILYKTAQDDLTFQAQYIPGTGTESLYTRIDEAHAGTKEDPIPYHVNMEVFEGKYYTEDGILYRCTRNSGQALQNKASELVGHYFEAVK